MAGGDLSFGGSGSKDGIGSASLELNPKIGYFLKDNFALGLGLNFQLANQYNSMNYSPFMRYYVKKFYGEYTYSFGRTNLSSTTTFINSSGTYSIGYAAFLNNNVALEPSVFVGDSYNYRGYTYGFKMGLQIYFNR